MRWRTGAAADGVRCRRGDALLSREGPGRMAGNCEVAAMAKDRGPKAEGKATKAKGGGKPAPDSAEAAAKAARKRAKREVKVEVQLADALEVRAALDVLIGALEERLRELRGGAPARQPVATAKRATPTKAATTTKAAPKRPAAATPPKAATAPKAATTPKRPAAAKRPAAPRRSAAGTAAATTRRRASSATRPGTTARRAKPKPPAAGA
ncbi:MAG: hypothetical protein ACXVAP_02165 [Candidatus Limnocylindrales bacterium]